MKLESLAQRRELTYLRAEYEIGRARWIGAQENRRPLDHLRPEGSWN